jgi:hypothetical protein
VAGIREQWEVGLVTAEQTHSISLRSLMTEKGWREYVRYEIRRETAPIATTRHACECGGSCRRTQCAKCWRALLEMPTKSPSVGASCSYF